MNTFDFDTYSAELAYRRDQIRRGVGRNRHRVSLFGRRRQEVTGSAAR